MLAPTEELNRDALTHEMVVQRRRELFEALNGLREGKTDPCSTCANLREKPYKDVDFTFLGGEPLPTGMGLQHFSACNQRCTYCVFTVEDNFIKPQYDPIKYMELFRSAGKLRGNNWIDFSGGEGVALKDFDRILNYLTDNNLGTVVVYSNAAIFNQTLYDSLAKNKVILTTSLDTGVASTYNKLHGTKTFPKVIRNLIRYRNSGTHSLWLKCVICESNRSEDDLWSFVMAMLALRPNKIMISPDFPYGKDSVPEETLKFAAKLWYLIEELVGITPIDYSSTFGAPEWVKYHQDLPLAIEKVRAEGPLGRPEDIEHLEPALLRDVFKYRILRILGALWRSGLRHNLLPVGSRREQQVVNLYRKTLGRFIGE
jgi:uncharacterized Fe-S cluster-containing radical SAM superfamily protein